MEKQRFNELLPTAYRIAFASPIHCVINDVKRVTTSFGVDRFEISYTTIGKDSKDQTDHTPLLNDYRFGSMTEKIWNRTDGNGKNAWIGRRMTPYKHNDPPREGDKSSQGYRCIVYAEPLAN